MGNKKFTEKQKFINFITIKLRQFGLSKRGVEVNSGLEKGELESLMSFKGLYSPKKYTQVYNLF